MNVRFAPLEVARLEDHPELRVALDQAPCELELPQLLNKGWSFKPCAERMGVSDNTAKMQAPNAYRKLGAGNLPAAWYEAAAHLLA